MNKTVLVCLLALCCGCNQVVVDNSQDIPKPGKYLKSICVAAASSRINRDQKIDNPFIPEYIPDPNNPKVLVPANCSYCDHKGYVGDSYLKNDCPKCDSNGDGNVVDPDPTQKSTEWLPSKDELIQAIDRATKPQTDADLVWHQTSLQAKEEAKSKGVRILVLLNGPAIDEIWNDKDVKDFLSKNFVLLQVDTTEPAVSNAWAHSAYPNIVKNGLAKKNSSGVLFTETVLCVLSPEGNYLGTKESVYQKVPESSKELLDLLQTL